MPHQCTDCGRTFGDGSKEMLSGCPNCGGNTFQFLPADSVGDGTASAEPPSDSPPPSDPPDPPERPDGPGSVARTVGNAAATVRDLVSGSGSDVEDTHFEDPVSEPDPEPTPADGRAEAPSEDAAQADARRQVVSPDQLPEASSGEAFSRAPEAPPRPSDDHRVQSEQSAADGATSAPANGGQTPPNGGQTPPNGDPTPASDGPTPANGSEPHRSDRSPASEPTDRATDRPDLSQLREELNDQFESIRVVAPGQYELNLMELYDREEYIVALQEDGRYTIQVPDTWQD